MLQCDIASVMLHRYLSKRWASGPKQIMRAQSLQYHGSVSSSHVQHTLVFVCTHHNRSTSQANINTQYALNTTNTIARKPTRPEYPETQNNTKTTANHTETNPPPVDATRDYGDIELCLMSDS